MLGYTLDTTPLRIIDFSRPLFVSRLTVLPIIRLMSFFTWETSILSNKWFTSSNFLVLVLPPIDNPLSLKPGIGVKHLCHPKTFT